MAAAESLLDDRCEALILVAPQIPDTQLTDLGKRTPTIVVARKIRSAALDVVRTPDEEVVRTAIDHLTSLGHRNIAHLDGRAIRGASDRRRSYRTLMQQHGLEQNTKIFTGGNTEIEGMRAAQLVLAEPRATDRHHRVQRPRRRRADLRATRRRSANSRSHQHHRLRRRPHGRPALHRPHHRRTGRHRHRPLRRRTGCRPARGPSPRRKRTTRVPLPRRAPHHHPGNPARSTKATLKKICRQAWLRCRLTAAAAATPAWPGPPVTSVEIAPR